MIASLPNRTYSVPRLMLVVTLAIACVLGGLAAVNKLPPAAIAAPVALLAMAVFLREPNLALALLPAIGVVVPISVGTGSQSPIVAALMVAMLLMGLGIVRALRAETWAHGIDVKLPTIALMLVWVFALLWSNVEMSPLVTAWATFPMAQLGGAGVTVISAGILLMAMSVGKRGPWIKIAVAGLLASSAAAYGVYLIGQLNDVSYPFETGGLFTMWVVSISFGQALFNDRLSKPARIALFALALAWEFKAAVWQTWWFSGWLPALIVLVVLIFLRSRRLFAVVAAISTIISIVNFDALYKVVWGTTVEKGDLSRLDIWQQSFDLFGRHPILGTGPAGYAVYFQSLYAGSSFSMSTHNNYMDVLLQTGLVGALIFVWFLATMLIVGWRARSRWRTGFNGAFAQSGFAGLIGLIVSMSMGDWLMPFVYNQTIAGFRFTVHSWVFLGFLASLAMIRPSADQATPSTTR